MKERFHPEAHQAELTTIPAEQEQTPEVFTRIPGREVPQVPLNLHREIQADANILHHPETQKLHRPGILAQAANILLQQEARENILHQRALRPGAPAAAVQVQDRPAVAAEDLQVVLPEAGEDNF